MNEESRLRYLLAKPIAMAALDLSFVDRERYVAMACGRDAALLDEVRWMLRAAEVSTESIGYSPLAPRAAGDIAGARLFSSGSTCYRILRRLGEGGMGVVHFAERLIGEDAGEIRQLVALKFLNVAGVPGDELLRRFVEERRILAKLSHRNIAHLIDGGSMRDGRPFLALEYVQGEPIDQWCDRRKLTLSQRIELFLKVCSAVEYAHRQQVIHRDIKPANILVTQDGEPKLLDFGIARLLDQVDGMASRQTRTAYRALTLAYASPEQVNGAPLTAATDVWSLGVVLYQLVCGVHPFEVQSESALALSNAIVTAGARSPSWQMRKRHARRLPADIDTVVMKALRRDPGERYASVERLSADLRYFLQARPVQARRERSWRLTNAALRRSWPAMGKVALLFILLSCLAMQVMQLRQERQDAQVIAMLAQHVLSQHVFNQADLGIALGGTYRPRDGVLEAAMPTEQTPRVPLVSSLATAWRALNASETRASAQALADRGLAIRAIAAVGDARGSAVRAIECAARLSQSGQRGQIEAAADALMNRSDGMQQCPGIRVAPTWLERFSDADRHFIQKPAVAARLALTLSPVGPTHAGVDRQGSPSRPGLSPARIA
jgi:serine/threonine-protein kinase